MKSGDSGLNSGAVALASACSFIGSSLWFDVPKEGHWADGRFARTCLGGRIAGHFRTATRYILVLNCIVV
jgi:hypothetical protein